LSVSSSQQPAIAKGMTKLLHLKFDDSKMNRKIFKFVREAEQKMLKRLLSDIFVAVP